MTVLFRTVYDIINAANQFNHDCDVTPEQEKVLSQTDQLNEVASLTVAVEHKDFDKNNFNL